MALFTIIEDYERGRNSMNDEQEFNLLMEILSKIEKDGKIELSKMEFNDITEDLVFTFIGYLQAHCFIRINPMYHSLTVYTFTKPGHSYMKQQGKKHLFVAHFLERYRDPNEFFEEDAV